MKFFVFKPKRRKNGKLLVGRLYRGRYRLEEDSESIEVPLKVTDKQVAQSKDGTPCPRSAAGAVRDNPAPKFERRSYDASCDPRNLSPSFRCADEMNDTSSSGSQRFPVCSQNAAGNLWEKSARTSS